MLLDILDIIMIVALMVWFSIILFGFIFHEYCEKENEMIYDYQHEMYDRKVLNNLKDFFYVNLYLGCKLNNKIFH